MRKTARIAVSMAIVVCVAVPVLAAGCAPNSPEDAVQRFLNSIQKRDWNGYLSSVLPDNVRAMSELEMSSQREQFGKNTEEFQGLKLEVKKNKKNPDTANVVITGGSVVRKDPMTGKKEKTKFTDFPEEVRTLPAKKYKGYWYVDVPLVQETSETPE